MLYRSVRILISWYVGFVVWTAGEGSGNAQEDGAQDVLGQAVPAELRTWLTQTATPQALPPGSYPGWSAGRSAPPPCARAARLRSD